MKTIILKLFAIVMFSSCAGQKSEIYSSSSRAIGGYDPVAYFLENKPVTGNQEFSYEWKGANWYFSSKENHDLFAANPEKFAPQYGGWCAFGCSEGHKAPTDPRAWTIVDGKLYFNYNLDVKKEWLKNQKERIEKADKNWENVKNQ